MLNPGDRLSGMRQRCRSGTLVAALAEDKSGACLQFAVYRGLMTSDTSALDTVCRLLCTAVMSRILVSNSAKTQSECSDGYSLLLIRNSPRSTPPFFQAVEGVADERVWKIQDQFMRAGCIYFSVRTSRKGRRPAIDHAPKSIFV